MAEQHERRDSAIFFIYDHNVLKKEEDDLIDAILYFSPENVSADDQCALCGQLMGIAEFLRATLGKSSPRIYKFEHEKYAIKRIGAFSLCLQCKRSEPDSVVFKQLDHLYGTFITYHGSLNSLRLRCKDNNNNFLQDLGNIWRTILNISGTSLQPNISKIFHHLPYIQLPKTGSHLYLEASHLLQSSQRRPYVLGGAILYKNEVVCTQLPPTLTRQLTYLQVQMPYIEKKMDFELPVGCKICTMFLTDDELQHIIPLEPLSRRHCKINDFTPRRKSEVSYRDTNKLSHTKSLSRRQTCPNISGSLSLFEHQDQAVAGTEIKGSSVLGTETHQTFKKTANFVGVDRQSWGKSMAKVSLSHVPIVECQSGESPVDTDVENLTDGADDSYFAARSYRSSYINDQNRHRFEPLKHDIIDETDCDSEDDFQFSEGDRYIEDDKSKSQTTDTCSDDKEVKNREKALICGTNDKDVKTEKNREVENREKAINSSTNDKDMTIEKNREVENREKAMNSGSNDKDMKTENNRELENREIAMTGEPKIENDRELENRVKAMTVESPVIAFPQFSTSGGTYDREVEHRENEKGMKVETTKHTVIDVNVIIETQTEDDSDSSLSLKDIKSDTNLNFQAQSTKHNQEPTTEPKCILENDTDSISKISVKDTSSDKKCIRNECNENDIEYNIAKINFTENVGLKMQNETNCEIKDKKYSSDNTQGVISDENNVASEKGDGVLNASKNNQENVARDITDLKVISSESDSNDNSAIQLLKASVHEHSGVSGSTDDDKITVVKGKENVDPLNTNNMGDDFKVVKTKSEAGGLRENTGNHKPAIATDEPCISCLELQSENHKSAQQRCPQCLSKRKSHIINHYGDRKEVIAFSERDVANKDSVPNQSNGNDVDPNYHSVMSAESTFSSDVSTDSTISRFWTHEMDGLNDVTLYIQCHSDISLLLLMENPEQYQENLLHSLWKGSLHYLADLDFYIKECLEQKDPSPAENFSFTQFNKFSRDLKENTEDISSKKKGAFNQILATIHSEFDNHPSLLDVTLRGQANSCYGHRNQVNETFFQLDGPQRLLSGLPLPKDPNYMLDTIARAKLAKERHLSLM